MNSIIVIELYNIRLQFKNALHKPKYNDNAFNLTYYMTNPSEPVLAVSNVAVFPLARRVYLGPGRNTGYDGRIHG
jgi:hypothetical protein